MSPSLPRLLIRVLGTAWLVGMLSGCALWNSLRPDLPDGSPLNKEAAIELRQVYELRIEAPEPALSLLQQHLDLARFQKRPVNDMLTRQELERLIAAAPAQARSLLETLGYFAAEVQIRRDATGAPGATPLVWMDVRTGAQSKIAQVELKVLGDLALPEHQGLEATWRAAFPLKAGDFFSQSAWTDAKTQSVGFLKQAGFPRARWVRTGATVTAYTQPIDVYGFLEVDSGLQARIGEVKVIGLTRHDPSSVLNVALFRQGSPYTETLLNDYAERLRKIGLFERVQVDLDPEAPNMQSADVIVRVSELPLQQAVLGVGYSSHSGARMSAEHLNRRAWNRPWMWRNKLDFGSIHRRLESELSSHPLSNGYRHLTSVLLATDRSGDIQLETRQWRIGRVIDTDRIDRFIFAEVQSSLSKPLPGSSSTGGPAVPITPVLPSGKPAWNTAYSGNYHWVFSELDNPLLPTRGLTANLQAALGWSHSAQTENGSFAKAYARVTHYGSLGAGWWTQSRIEVGQVWAGAQVGLPDSLLFRAGGEDSVRGYAHNSLGPEVGGVTRFGTQLMTASIEWSRPISASFPSVWGAAFVDAGQAALSWRQWRPVWGVGAGLRWRSPVGPLKIDLAWGEDQRRPRLHFSVGIAL